MIYSQEFCAVVVLTHGFRDILLISPASFCVWHESDYCNFRASFPSILLRGVLKNRRQSLAKVPGNGSKPALAKIRVHSDVKPLSFHVLSVGTTYLHRYKFYHGQNLRDRGVCFHYSGQRLQKTMLLVVIIERICFCVKI